ncbi:HNH endonuclease [Mucilaginibacter rubeus]|uniref:HNH endonuclease n=1 Tax=Mucilaginibacter rubeus TaxID=2027860 RepID=A0A5C1HT74_9SPHI|nr:HNH endonuclease [Mucilaginibacter rubeus]QEM09082.1 HNH endonuclease [Mucilaginibacter rubeus]
MEEPFEHTYLNTYYYSNIIDNILTGDIELIGFISDFFNENYTYITPFEKFSVLHQFISYNIFRFLQEDIDNYDQKAFRDYELGGKLPKLYVEQLVEEYDLGYEFERPESDEIISYSDIEEYHSDLVLTGHLEEICERIAHEVFYLLFNNRNLLVRFNHIVAQHVSEITIAVLEEDEDLEDLAVYLRKDGILHRVDIPMWCKNAVFFREKGRCCLCGNDLTKILRPDVTAHYDHMVPLAQGGINDVSNIQLLCSSCNLSKGKKDIITSNQYYKWY